MLLMTNYAKNYMLAQSIKAYQLGWWAHAFLLAEPISHGSLFIELEVTD